MASRQRRDPAARRARLRPRLQSRRRGRRQFRPAADRGHVRYGALDRGWQARDATQGLLFVALRGRQDDRLYRRRRGKRQTLPCLDKFPRQPYFGAGDRTSVVEGKSVAVRGDMGGRRMSKKKTWILGTMKKNK